MEKRPKDAKKVAKNKHAGGLILSPYLYLGPRTAASTQFLTAHGITHVLSIGATPVSRDSRGVAYNRLSLADDISSSIEEVSENAGTIIEAAKAANGKILVHCSAAVSRSPTIVAAYLMKNYEMSLKEALGTIIRARPAVCPNSGFLEQLKTLEMKLRGSLSLEVDALPAKKEQRLELLYG